MGTLCENLTPKGTGGFFEDKTGQTYSEGKYTPSEFGWRNVLIYICYTNAT